MIRHGLKEQAGTFGCPMILEIALVAEQYVKAMPDYEDAKLGGVMQNHDRVAAG